MKLGLISDIHEDAHNLKVVLRKLHGHCDDIACLGDVVGYSKDFYSHKADANECVRLVRENCRYVVAGNHDLFAVERIPSHHGKSHFPTNWFSLNIEEKRRLKGKTIWLYENEESVKLSEENHAFVTSLPEYLVVESHKIRILLTHFIYPDITGSESNMLSIRQSISSHSKFMKENCCELAICGHTHIEGLVWAKEIKKRLHKVFVSPTDVIPFRKPYCPETHGLFSIPCITSGFRRPGYAIYDSESHQITAFNL